MHFCHAADSVKALKDSGEITDWHYLLMICLLLSEGTLHCVNCLTVVTIFISLNYI